MERTARKRSPAKRQEPQAARRREIDCVLVWRLDRWGRSLVDLVTTLQELMALGVGFVSLSEALDMTTPSGRTLAGMFAKKVDPTGDHRLSRASPLKSGRLQRRESASERSPNSSR